jgi:holliday junction DNA helicase RuvB
MTAMSERQDMNDVSPTSLSHLVGQKNVVMPVRVAIDAAQQDGKKVDHMLMTGGAGLGKTQTAKIVAAEMGSDFHEVLGQAIQSPADLNALLLGTKDKDIIFVDEAHELDREFQTSLYLALDQRRLFLQNGRSGRTPQSLPVADFSLLLATTDEYRLLQPLRDRMRLVLRFDFYSPDELEELLKQRSRALCWPVADNVFLPIAHRSRGTPRLALRLLQACYRVARSEGENVITFAHLEFACQLERIDPLGLGPVEQQYLRVLNEGASRLNVIASRLGLPSRTVADVCEAFLLRAGLVVKDDGGRRQLTAEGREHLSKNRLFHGESL